jgi:hypothetical protein
LIEKHVFRLVRDPKEYKMICEVQQDKYNIHAVIVGALRFTHDGALPKPFA